MTTIDSYCGVAAAVYRTS